MRQGRTSAPSGQERLLSIRPADLALGVLASAQALGQVSAVGRKRTSGSVVPAPSAPHDQRAILPFPGDRAAPAGTRPQ